MAARSRFLMVDGRDEARRERCESATEVLPVAGRWRIDEELFDDGQVVVERAHGGESVGVGIAVVAAGGGEHEGGGDEIESDAAVVESGREPAIGGTRAARRFGDAAVEIEDTPDVGGGNEHGVAGLWLE